jgi:hypothetical protein
MYKAHQGGQSLCTAFEADAITFSRDSKEKTLPGLAGSAS